MFVARMRKSAEDQRCAADGGQCTEDAGNNRAEAGKADAGANTGGVKRGRRDHEAEAELQCAGGAEFAAVGMAVEEGEDADDGSGRRDGQADGGGDQQAETDDGSKNRGLNEGQADARDGERKAERHRADEGGRNGEKRAATDLRGPEADGDHGEDVVSTEQRMRNTGHEGAMLLRVQVGEGGSRGGGEKGGGE